MKRKLFALLLSGLAITLLMGAGEDEYAAAAESVDSAQTVGQYAPAEEMDSQTYPEVSYENTEDAQEETVAVPEVDTGLLIDGQPAPMAASRFIENGVSYVSLKVMSQLLDPAAQVFWDDKNDEVTITATQLSITAEIGKQYLVANGRYLYIPEGVRLINGQSVVPLKVLAKAFGAEVSWDEGTQTVLVMTGARPLESGETYYNADDLFWLSRVIFAESGGQTLRGQIAVGNVIMNRVRSSIWPDSIFEVISQRNQFSTYRGGRLAKRTPSEKAVISAKLVLDGAVVSEVAEAYFFDSARSSWASRNKTCVAVIGGHRFFDY